MGYCKEPGICSEKQLCANKLADIIAFKRTLCVITNCWIFLNELLPGRENIWSPRGRGQCQSLFQPTTEDRCCRLLRSLQRTGKCGMLPFSSCVCKVNVVGAIRNKQLIKISASRALSMTFKALNSGPCRPLFLAPPLQNLVHKKLFHPETASSPSFTDPDPWGARPTGGDVLPLPTAGSPARRGRTPLSSWMGSACLPLTQVLTEARLTHRHAGEAGICYSKGPVRAHPPGLGGQASFSEAVPYFGVANQAT